MDIGDVSFSNVKKNTINNYLFERALLNFIFDSIKENLREDNNQAI